MKLTQLLMIAILTLSFSATAKAEVFTFEQILDDTGRAFNPGDFITMNMSNVNVQTVEMDCKGYRGAVATLYIDGLAYESKRLTTYRQNYSWFVGSVLGSQVEIRFTDIDPIVYSTKVTYEAPVEVIFQTQIEYVEVEVAKRNLYAVGMDMRTTLDTLYAKLKLHPTYSLLIDEGLRIAEELVFAGSNSNDSDSSIVTQKYAVELVNTLDCKVAKKVLRKIGKEDRELKMLIRSLRTDLSLSREHLDHHIDNCSSFVLSL